MKIGQPISKILAQGKPTLSVEFFPPKDEAGGQLILQTALAIKEHIQPDFVSITYGAGGTTRERTRRYAFILKEGYDFEVMPHLTCVGNSRAEMIELVKDYYEKGFRNIMALRGDPPKGETTFTPHPDGPQYASELVHLLHPVFPDLCFGVAGYPEVHPEATDAATDRLNLKRKLDEGGSFVTTQLFFDNANYFQFVKDCRAEGIDAPIIPGLMPVRSAKQARRFCEHIPAELDAMMTAAGDDKAKIEAVGVEWSFRQIKELLEGGAPGVHLYIMNRSQQSLALVEKLRAAKIL